MADSIQYATTAETLSDFFPNVNEDNTEQVPAITRLLVAASGLIDRYTDRPPGYFLGIGPNVSTKQKINIAIDADGILTDCVVRLSITAAALPGSPIELDVNAVALADDSASIATAFAAMIAADQILAAFLNVTDNGGDLDLEIDIPAPIDSTFAAAVAGVGVGTGIVATTSTVVEAGAYAVPATVRRYRGRGENFLRVGRYVPGTLSISGFAEGDFYESTPNGWPFATDTPATVPGGYDDDRYTTRPIKLFACDALYLVSARWGFAETPGDIVTACKLIAQHIWDRGQGTFGQVTPSGFVIDRDIPPPVRLILDNWKRKEFELN